MHDEREYYEDGERDHNAVEELQRQCRNHYPKEEDKLTDRRMPELIASAIRMRGKRNGDRNRRRARHRCN